MKSTLEREVKLRGGPRFQGVSLPGEPIPEHTLVSADHDTDDLRLAGAGVTLRRRSDTAAGATPKWQLKLPRAAGRLELEWDAPDERLPDEVADLLIAYTRRRPVSRVAVLRTRREGVLVTDGGRGIAEVVDDNLQVLDDDDAVVRTFEELEVELVEGRKKELRRIEKRLRKAGATDPEGRPKLLQALDLRPRPAPRPGKRDTPAQVTAVLQAQFRRLLLHDPVTRLGVDPEGVHQQRVATRELRAVLRAARPMLDRAWADGLRHPLKHLGVVLGEVRDLDVMLAELRSEADRLDEPEAAGARRLLTRLQARRDLQQAHLRAELGEAWYVSLLNRLDAAVHAPEFKKFDLPLAARAAREHRRARRLVARLGPGPADEQLHAVRKAVKRARYAAELAAEARVPGTASYANRAKRVQDILGDHQDAVMPQATLKELAGNAPTAGEKLAAAELADIQRARKDTARAEFPAAWRNLDKRGRALA
jgi:CHAD domain-containing protein